jgi:hypothetical protein
MANIFDSQRLSGNAIFDGQVFTGGGPVSIPIAGTNSDTFSGNINGGLSVLTSSSAIGTFIGGVGFSAAKTLTGGEAPFTISQILAQVPPPPEYTGALTKWVLVRHR